MDVSQLQPQLPPRVEPIRETGHEGLQGVPVSVLRGQQEQEVVFYETAQPAQDLDARGGGVEGQGVGFVRGFAVEGVELRVERVRGEDEEVRISRGKIRADQPGVELMDRGQNGLVGG